MVRISVLNDALRNMVNAERKGKRQVRTRNQRTYEQKAVCGVV